jgi:glutathionylspermidine synthase
MNNNTPIKLIEFNADTPTSLFETMIIQWAMLKFNNLDESSQFNSIYEAIGDNFRRCITLNGELEKIIFIAMTNDLQNILDYLVNLMINSYLKI